ncbi:LysR family transcriptional regulator [Marinobacter confluentis]|uniref:LysR family transcriptional regulator n=1 Tax=Marinobacter confluentis TaxID=1697557 RepID=A0A4Z1BAZ5_9GAMM|nr:LysR family transcriptional regulator [Marinobacter confluentis]TGN39116.1 LysR family transcriptional regulator [Marinobacter confluentis]
MNKQKIRWDDLQIVLAIARTGSLSGASRTLGVSHATVFRRLNDMERDLGVTLFHRGRNGYEATPLGEDLAGSAEKVEGEILGAERRVAGNDLQLAGTIRLTTTDTLFSGLLADILASFRQRHPAIQLEVVISNQQQSLSKREADIAVRPTNSPPETLVGRCIGTIKQAVYGEQTQWGHIKGEVAISDIINDQWITPDAQMGDTPMENWLARNVPESSCRYRIDSVLAMQTAVSRGNGLAILPCYIGDNDERLRRLTPPIVELETGLWLLTHMDSKRVSRIKQLMKELSETIQLK